MVEFQLSEDPPDYSGPIAEDPHIEDPIVPMREIGTTIVEHDPRTGAGILQNIEANIRKGASKMQLMWQTGSNSALGGRPKAYGKDVRQAIREMLEANEVELVGAELPTSTNTNMSGMDRQQGSISEEKRLRDIQEVKEAIDFQVEAAGGGGVDIWSQEFDRSIADESRNINTNSKYRFFDNSPEELRFQDKIQEVINDPKKKLENMPHISGVKYLVDERTGQLDRESVVTKDNVMLVPEFMTAKDLEKEAKELGKPTEIIGVFDKRKKEVTGNGKIEAGDLVDAEGKWIDTNDATELNRRMPVWDRQKQEFKTRKLDWANLIRESHEYNKGKPQSEQVRPEEYAARLNMDSRISQYRGQSLYHSREYEETQRDLLEIKNQKTQLLKRQEELKKIFKDDKEGYEFAVQQEMQKFIPEGRASPHMLQELARNPDHFFEEQSRRLQHRIQYINESSASADAAAQMLEDKKKRLKSPEDLAKENTWKSYAELGIYAMQKSKDPRAKKDVYVGPELGWPTAFGGHPKEFIEVIQGARKKMVEELTAKGTSKSAAEDAARKHIRGDFDTGHLGMWYNHFEGKPGESEESKLKRFNSWYIDMVEEMRKADVIGSIQVVDQISGQHGHLPAGQGIFPVVDAVKHLKKKGWKGDIVSEGHEEEKFGDGRILTETWKAFGSPIGTGYWGGSSAPSPRSWGGVQGSYFGATVPPTYIVGAYVPSNEWSLWSEVPFE